MLVCNDNQSNFLLHFILFQGDQVRKIIGMKNHLEKLKDMLEVVKDTESILEVQNTNESDNEIQDNARAVCPKSDNLKCSKNRTQSESNISLIDPKTKDMKTNEKQINKCIINENERKRMQLQSELQAKKRELEELMCKHKGIFAYILVAKYIFFYFQQSPQI